MNYTGGLREKRLRHVAKMVEVNSDSLWLDVGCYDGRLFELTPPALKVGTDLKINVGKNCLFLVSSAEYFPFRNSVFDLVTSLEVIEHLPNDFQHLREIHRVLKPQGLFILETTNDDRLTNRFKRLLGLTKYITKGKSHLREYHLTELLEMISSLFRVESVRGFFLPLIPIFVHKLASRLHLYIEDSPFPNISWVFVIKCRKC